MTVDRKKILNITLGLVAISLIIGISMFIYNSFDSYDIQKGFTSIPLQYNPDDNSSSYQLNGVLVTASGGFVKGILTGKDGTDTLIIRALSPLPSIVTSGNAKKNFKVRIENINPDFFASCVATSMITITKVTANSIEIQVSTKSNQNLSLIPTEPTIDVNMPQNKYIILGDNRDGYDTFATIIQQVNSESPAFVIDNGDLVFSGKPNQYRIFDQMTSNIATTMCTTLGNHDIRGNGRDTYTKLYGPGYYSFNFDGNHFVFLDSSPGWAKKTSISNEQYTWLEKDLIKAQGKRIFVVTHIPTRDPRPGVAANAIPNYINNPVSTNWLEQQLNNYSLSKSMNHGFQDPLEQVKFEDLMTKYHVDTVFLSHIHSFLSYTKDGVQYVITGGAGAELLTENSYYHFIIKKFNDSKAATVIELPSPTNNYLVRYGASIQLFAIALYKENPGFVIFLLIGLALFVVLLILRLYFAKAETFHKLGRWLLDIGKYGHRHFKEVFMISKTENSPNNTHLKK